MEIRNSLREAGYQVLLFHLVVQSAVETRKRFLKRASQVELNHAVKPVTLSFMTAKHPM